MKDLSFQLRRFIFAVLLLGFSAVLWALWQFPDGMFHVWFLDVGQGDAILIETPESHQILIDGGPGSKVMEELADVMPFFDRSIDLLVLSHPHADHIDGLVEVLKRYEVGLVMFSGANFKNNGYDEFLREINEKKIPFMIAESKNDLRFGEVFIDVLYPFEQVLLEDFKNINNSSVVLKVHYKDRSILLTGDMEEEQEKLLLEKNLDLKADVLKAGHHGSKTSTSSDFLLKVRPEVVVIQSGANNSFGHPAPETLKNLEAMDVKKVYRNDLDGRVELVF